MAEEITLKIGGNSKEMVAAVKAATDGLGQLAGASAKSGTALAETGAKATTATKGLQEVAGAAQKAEAELSEVAGAAKSADAGLDGVAAAAQQAETGLDEVAGSAQQADAALEQVSGSAKEADAGLEQAASGAKAADASLDGVTGAAKQAEGGLEKVAAGAKKSGKALADAAPPAEKKADALKKLGERAAALEQGLQHLAIGTTALVAPLGLATKQAVDFDAAMRNVDSIAKLSPDAFEKLRGEVLALAKDPSITQGPTLLAKGLYDIQSSGFEGEQALEALRASAIAATAGLTDTATTARVLTAVMNSGIPGVNSFREASDVLFATVDKGVITFEQLANELGPTLPLAAKAGVSIQEIGAAFAVMTKNGINASESATAIRGLLTQIVSPSKQATAALGEHAGILSINNLRAVGLAGVMKQLDQAFAGNTDQLTEIIPEVRALMAAFSLTQKGGADYTKMLDEMSRATEGVGSTQGALDRKLPGTQAKWEKLRAELEAVSIELGTKLLPHLNKLLDWAAKHPDVVIMGGAIAGVAVAVTQLAQAAVALKAAGLADLLAKIGGGSALAGGGAVLGVASSAIGGWLIGSEINDFLWRGEDDRSREIDTNTRLQRRRNPAAFRASDLDSEIVQLEHGPGGLYTIPPSRWQERAAAQARVDRARKERDEIRRTGKIPEWSPAFQPSEAVPPTGLSALSPKAGVNLAGLTPDARKRLDAMDAVLAKLGASGSITSAKDGHKGVKSKHNEGIAVDFVVPGQDMRALAKELQRQGFRVTFEPKGKRNANGSVSSGDHLHGDLSSFGIPTSPRQLTEAERERQEAARKALADARRQAAVDAMDERTVLERRDKDLARLRLEEQREKEQLAEQAETAGRPVDAKHLADLEKGFKGQRLKVWQDAEAELKELREKGAQELQRSAEQALEDQLSALSRYLAQRRRLLTAAGMSEADIELDLARRQVEVFQSLRERDDRGKLLDKGRRLPELTREDRLEQPAFSAQQRLQGLEAAEQARRQAVVDSYVASLAKTFEEINEIAAQLDADEVDAEKRRLEAADAVRARAERLAAARKELAELAFATERDRAEARGPAALQEFLQGRMTTIDAALKNLQQPLAGPDPSDTEEPQGREESEEETLRRQQRIAALYREREEILQRIAALERQAAEDAADRSAARVEAHDKEIDARRDFRQVERDVNRELGTRQAERRGPEALRAFLAGELAKVRAELAQLEVLRKNLGGVLPEDVSARYFDLKRLKADMEESLGQIRTRWQRFWRDLGQDAANSLKGALAGSIEDALMGQFDARKLGEELRRVVARSISIAITETLSRQISRGFSRLVGGRGAKPAAPAANPSSGSPAPTNADPNFVGPPAPSAVAARGGADPASDRMLATVGMVTAGLSTLVGAFKEGGDGMKAQIPLLIAALVQLVMAFMVAKMQIAAGPAGAIVGVVSMIASMFSHDSPMQDSKARGLGFSSVAGVGQAQVGRWGFDFGTAFNQGRNDALKSQTQSQAPAPQRGGGKRDGMTVHAPVTVNNYAPINTQADANRMWDDAGWVFSRRLRTAGDG